MKIHSANLKARAEEMGLSKEALASVVARPGLTEKSAFSAVSNWMVGRDQPRCRPEDVAKLAEALGCEPKSIVRFVSASRFQRSSPRKAKLLTDLIRGKQVVVAQDLLKFNKKRAAGMVLKTLNAAIADAEVADADIGALVVAESRVDGAVHIKRFQPKDRGRAHPILKRTCHITVGVEERA